MHLHPALTSFLCRIKNCDFPRSVNVPNFSASSTRNDSQLATVYIFIMNEMVVSRIEKGEIYNVPNQDYVLLHLCLRPILTFQM